MSYYTAYICKKGHVASSTGIVTTKHCNKCGSLIISSCQECGAPILGKYYDDGIFFLPKYELPYFCGNCGKPYPWTSDILSKATELISLDADLDDEIKSLLIDSFMDLVVETPGSSALAVARYKKYLTKLSKIAQDGLRQLIIDVATDSIKKNLFGQ